MVEKEEVLRELSELAMFDPRGLFDDDGRLLPIAKMDRAMAKSVQEMDVNVGRLNGKIIRRIKVKSGRDQLEALEMLMRYYNAYQFDRYSG